MKHANVSVFVPHAGCPHQCSFCDQRAISGARDAPDGAAVAALCARAERELAQKGRTAQIAFFGGSFTAVSRPYMIELLEAARPFLGRGVFTGVRVSTRPDCIDDETLDTLTRYGVTAVELGAQSMDDAVLSKNGRGHTADDTNRASALVRAHGLELGLQMMTGLYGANEASDLMSARLIAALMPATVRVYPTLVLEGTRLAAFTAHRRMRRLRRSARVCSNFSRRAACGSSAWGCTHSRRLPNICSPGRIIRRSGSCARARSCTDVPNAC